MVGLVKVSISRSSWWVGLVVVSIGGPSSGA